MKFEDLENIVLEGGGAKGVVYKGAIIALETLCKNDASLISVGGKKAILDYKLKDKDELKIKGLAGSSAGSITAFALALGLNSSEIEKVLDYPFTKFLSEKDVGKYRMVGSGENNDTKLYIGEDKLKKLGGHKTPFTYLTEKYVKITGDGFKYIFRKAMLILIIESIAEGLLRKVTLIQRFISQFDLNKWLEKNVSFFKMVGINLPDKNYFNSSGLEKLFTNIGIFKILQLLLTKVIFRKKVNEPLTLDFDTIGNLIWDRGMFSGFAVREFFFDLVLFAVTRDTHFKRQYIKWSEDKNTLTEKQIKSLINFKIENYNFEKRSNNYQDNKKSFDENQFVIEKLQCLTFKHFYEITNINIGFNVTNFTTDSSMLFSHIHTPDFLILEAVAASMSIPPAIKPLYNEADVFKPKGYTGKNIKVTKGYKPTKEIKVIQFVDEKGNFEIDDYDLFHTAVKKYISDKNSSSIRIDTNNSINNSNYLMLMMLEIVDKILDGKTMEIGFSVVHVDNYSIEINLNLLTFYYNSAYKGMMMDGGALCNIPYYFFREITMISENTKTKDSIDNVLALKLDNTFPAEWLQAGKDLLNNSGDVLASVAFLNKAQKTILGYKFKGYFRVELFKNINRKTSSKIEKSDLNLEGSLNDLLDEQNKDSWEKIAEEIIENNRNKRKLKPWEKQKSIFGLINTLGYGSEDGQIRFLSDHNHIISLYSYGIGTYDFDIDKIKPLVKLSQKHSEIKVNKFFGNSEGK